MTMTISRDYLFNVERGEPEEAELWAEITEQQLADWEGEWVPELFKAMQRLRRAGVERRHWPQSRHWNWRKKTETFQGMLAHPGFSIVCDGVGRAVERAYTPEEREALGDALSALGDTTFDIYLNSNAFWRNVPAAVWRYKLGGYQVLKKWLSYRDRAILYRPLRPDEVQHFTDTVRRIAAILSMPSWESSENES